MEWETGNVFKPENADWYDWDKFAKFCIENDIDTHPDDYGLFWECWKKAYIAAMNA